MRARAWPPRSPCPHSAPLFSTITVMRKPLCSDIKGLACCALRSVAVIPGLARSKGRGRVLCGRSIVAPGEGGGAAEGRRPLLSPSCPAHHTRPLRTARQYFATILPHSPISFCRSRSPITFCTLALPWRLRSVVYKKYCNLAYVLGFAFLIIDPWPKSCHILQACVALEMRLSSALTLPPDGVLRRHLSFWNDLWLDASCWSGRGWLITFWEERNVL